MRQNQSSLLPSVGGVVLLLVFLSGCTTTMALTTEDLRADSSRGIVVSTKDGRQIRFSGGDYSLRADSLGGDAIAGRGKLYRDRQPQFVPFDGSILSSDVDKITAAKANVLLYVFLGSVAAVVAIALAMRSSPGPGG